jgi:phosphodiesterase/alkaline phosphatase D-like protein
VSAKEATAENLQPGAQYTACLVSSNTSGEQVGNPVHFTTLLAAPKVDGPETATVTPYEARLEAQINPDGQETHYSFEYASEEEAGKLKGTITTITGAAAIPAGSADVAATAEAGHVLAPSTTYYFRVVAENATLPATDGAVSSFTTLPAKAPELFGETAAEVGPTTAELEVQLFPQYQSTTVSFTVAEKETEVIAGAGPTVATFSAPAVPPGTIAAGFPYPMAVAQATGLQPNHTYFFRASAENATGKASPNLTVQRFTTSTVPLASTGGSSGVSANGATVSGNVNPEGLPTSYYFQYGGTTDYASQTATLETAGDATASPSVALAGLQPGVTYHYRLVATNVNLANCSEISDHSEHETCEHIFANTGSYRTPQTSYGEDETFSTPSTPPLLTGLTASAVTQSTATITAALNPQGLTTRWELKLGSTQGSLQPITSGQATSETALSIPVGNLTPGTVYFYRLTASSANGTVEPEGAFTTVAGPPPAAQPGLPALIPYTPVSQITAREEAENKKNSKPPALTNKQKLEKALKVCRKDKKKSKRAKCERAAHKKYPTAKKK